MNYFGLFFTFLIPGILIGLAAAVTLAGARRRKARGQSAGRVCEMQSKRGLYIHSMTDNAA